MKAIEYDRYGGLEVMEYREVAQRQPGPAQIRVKVAACALNPKDALVRAGKFKALAGPTFPKRMGYDYAGRVDALGAQVRDVQAGDAVFGMLNGFTGGACAEYLLASAGEYVTQPASLTALQAAAIPLAALTALQALRDLGGVRQGSRVCIHGASGGVGTFAVQVAKALGAQVTALCSAPNHALVESLGADKVVDYRQTAPHQLPPAFDCFFDVFGNQSLAAIRPVLAPRGVYVSTVPSTRNIRDHVLTMWWPGKKARLVVVKSKTADLQQLAQWVEQGQLKPVIETTLQLNEMRRAHELIQSKRTRGKIVLLPENFP